MLNRLKKLLGRLNPRPRSAEYEAEIRRLKLELFAQTERHMKMRTAIQEALRNAP